MTKTVLAVIFFLTVHVSYGQQDGLILIDAENNQPFYARLDSKVYFSSPIGHLVISRLKDSTYQIAIGFTGAHARESRFLLVMTRKDQGYQLRDMNEQGLALYNWQTRELRNRLPDDASGAAFAATNGVRRNDAFARLMAAVVNDSLVMYNTFIDEPLAVDSTKLAVAKATMPADSLGKKPDSVSVVPVVAVSKAGKKKRSRADTAVGIFKLKDIRYKLAIHQLYIIRASDGVVDTVRIMIPFDTVKRAAVVGDSAKLAGVVKPAAVRPCAEVATDKEVEALRAGMIAENTLDKKMEVAKNFLFSKCISVKQVKGLSELFVHDKNRLEFYQLAYPAVFDRDHFSELAALLSDQQYVKQFNASF